MSITCHCEVASDDFFVALMGLMGLMGCAINERCSCRDCGAAPFYCFVRSVALCVANYSALPALPSTLIILCL